MARPTEPKVKPSVPLAIHPEQPDDTTEKTANASAFGEVAGRVVNALAFRQKLEAEEGERQVERRRLLQEAEAAKADLARQALSEKTESASPVTYIYCQCLHCRKIIRFSQWALGTTFFCPHCNQQTMYNQQTLRHPQDISSSAIRTATSHSLPTPPTLLRQEPNTDAFGITLSPGQIRYLALSAEFLEADIENLISQIKELSPNPTLARRPEAYIGGEVYRSTVQGYLNLGQAHGLIAKESWDVQLRISHALGQALKSDGMPPWVYSHFHTRLGLRRQFAVAECIEAWVKGTAVNCGSGNYDLACSYKASPDHLFVQDEWNFCVFVKTDFVKKKLLEATERAEEQTAKENLETLRKSRFDSFVYLMEDRRNGTFKIGRSKTPGKRERTLQSEVPEIVLRFSIPADENDERKLHERFDPKRQRGEWFNLTADELLWIVSFLKKSGDVSRVSADYEWLGTITLKCSSQVGGE
jgi:hypothetical protein